MPSSGATRRVEESIVVHGTDRVALSAVAVALARRRAGSFAWADCAGSAPGRGLPTRRWLERHVGQPAVEVVDPSLLKPRDLEGVLLRHLVPSKQRQDESRLLDHLAMPELFQRLAARAIVPNGHGVVVLVNVDAISPTLRANTVETSRLHQTLHEEGLSVILTWTGVPSAAMRQVADRLLRIDVPVGRPWTEGWLAEEKEGGVENDGARLPLETAWVRLGLDLDLLSVS